MTLPTWLESLRERDPSISIALAAFRPPNSRAMRCGKTSRDRFFPGWSTRGGSKMARETDGPRSELGAPGGPKRLKIGP
jgi:hypothetical protein